MQHSVAKLVDYRDWEIDTILIQSLSCSGKVHIQYIHTAADHNAKILSNKQDKKLIHRDFKVSSNS